MLFNSLQFVFFFIAVSLFYYQLPFKWRWILLLLASCFFYMAFVPKYILIILLTIIIDYAAGLLMSSSEGFYRKIYLILSLCANIGILIVFKYYNFINENIAEVLQAMHTKNFLPALKIVLPIGLSFHTFQAMSYTIEVYKGKQKAEKHFGIYALYVLFFPQMVAGPIERPQNLIHQFKEHKNFNWERFKPAIILMLIGFFKKLVIADRLSNVVDYSYAHLSTQNGLSTIIAVICYSFQIYCDFSGYTDIALGAASVLGIDLIKNFNRPYLATSLSEFWRRWHMSLSSWFRDYVYIPLGGNKVNQGKWIFNILLVFALSGLWHGANWVFVGWGFIHGFGLVFEHFLKFKWPQKMIYIKTKQMLGLIWTFSFVSIAWIFFRSSNFPMALKVLSNITRFSIHDKIITGLNRYELLFCFTLIISLLVSEKWLPAINHLRNFNFWFITMIAIIGIYFFGIFNEQQFIYFQF